jgi:REP element-mobilizing transposase RayT
VTAPREILPGKTYLVTRRCTQRQFLLKPSPRTNQIIEYCLAVAAKQTGVLIHAVCFMSNHWHGVITDPLARLPEFLERFHRLVARAQNAALGRCENLWSSEKPSVVLLVSDHDVLEKMAYTIANPTAAGLVRSPDGWPGVLTRRLVEQRRIAMPDTFFSPDGPLPESAILEITRPPIYLQLSLPALARHLHDAVDRLTRNARQLLADARRRFVGVQAVLQQPFDGKPTSLEPRRSPNPRIAAKHTPARVDAIRSLKAFIQSYRAAWQAWRQGNRAQLFPCGTYALRLHARVACRPP